MRRHLSLAFGVVAYLVSFITILYAVGFVGSLGVPKGIDDGLIVSWPHAVVVNLLLLTLFALQHSVMARPGFKAAWTLVVPQAIERSVFVLFASLVLLLLFWQWRPIPELVWSMTNPVWIVAANLLFWAGWAIVLLSTFMISHLELFGLKQVVANWRRQALSTVGFETPGLYRLVRHPIYLGFLLAFWATPTMTMGHLLFALVTTAYILLGIQLEERDLVRLFGAAYENYRHRVGMLLPRLWAAGEATTISAKPVHDK